MQILLSMVYIHIPTNGPKRAVFIFLLHANILCWVRKVRINFALFVTKGRMISGHVRVEASAHLEILLFLVQYLFPSFINDNKTK